MTRERDGHTPQRRRFFTYRHLSRASVLAVLLFLPLMTGYGCSTARDRQEPGSIFSNPRLPDDGLRDHLSSVYRSATLYTDFRTTLNTDVVFLDGPYRLAYVEMARKRFLLTPEDTQALLLKEDEAYNNRFEFFVFAYGGTHERLNLHRPAAHWKVTLKDDDGQLFQPLQITRIERGSDLHRYLETHFSQLDRWTEAYRVSFPKLDKMAAGLKTGPEPFRLIISGVGGSVTLGWDDPALFYGAPLVKPEEKKASGFSH